MTDTNSLAIQRCIVRKHTICLFFGSSRYTALPISRPHTVDGGGYRTCLPVPFLRAWASRASAEDNSKARTDQSRRPAGCGSVGWRGLNGFAAFDGGSAV